MSDKELATLLFAAPFLALCFGFMIAEACRIAAQLRAERIAVRVRATPKRGR